VLQIKKGYAALNQWWQANKWFRVGLQWFIVLVAFSLMGTNLYQNWQLVQQYSWTFDPFSLTVSFACLFFAFLLLPLSTRLTMLMLDHNLPYSLSYRAYFLSQMAKYIPGGIWIVPGRVLVLRQVGVRSVASSLGMFVELYVLVITGLMLFTPYLILQNTVPVWLAAAINVCLLLLLGLLYTPLVPQLLNRFTWLSSIKFKPDWHLLQLTAVLILFWLLLGTGFFWLIKSLQEGIGIELWLPAAAAYSSAWVVGFLVFVTPGGLGVREATLAFLLVAFLPLPIATLVALMARLWWLLAEIACVIVATMMPRV
jgi:uncharacterized membrane protein YbhN (UPF0104 family)